MIWNGRVDAVHKIPGMVGGVRADTPEKKRRKEGFMVSLRLCLESLFISR
jgi:hypothetical protein